jgi:membrane protein
MAAAHNGGRADESPLAIAAAYASGIWHKTVDDQLFFLASGVAFDILLSAVPFFLLLASGLGYVLNKSDDASSTAVAEFLSQLFPATFSGDGSLLDPLLRDVMITRGKAGLIGALAFIWFSTRLFGAMRIVLHRVFDDATTRGMFFGKMFDLTATMVSTVCIVAWIALSAYIALAHTGGVAILKEWGLHNAAVMRPLTYATGRVIAFVLLAVAFFALYKMLPHRKVRWQQAAIGGISCAVMFEIARNAFTAIVHWYNPASLYSGTFSVVVVAVFWVYYAALIFVLGGEISQVHERRRLAHLT